MLNALTSVYLFLLSLRLTPAFRHPPQWSGADQKKRECLSTLPFLLFIAPVKNDSSLSFIVFSKVVDEGL
jgi:hypothetical protein